jgi:hypothetical protein
MPKSATADGFVAKPDIPDDASTSHANAWCPLRRLPSLVIPAKAGIHFDPAEQQLG